MKRKKFMLPMKFNAGAENYEPDLEKIKEIGDHIKKENARKKLKIRKYS